MNNKKITNLGKISNVNYDDYLLVVDSSVTSGVKTPLFQVKLQRLSSVLKRVSCFTSICCRCKRNKRR